MLTETEIARLRAETPGADKVLHFNNAGAGLMPRAVLEAVKGHLDLEAETGGYEASAMREAELARPYDAIAAYLNCGRDEIALVENATVAWNQAFFAVLDGMSPGDRILTAEAEYASNYLSFLKAAGDRGVRVDVVPSDGDGALDVARLEDLIDDRVRLIAVTHVPTNGGLVNPAEEIGRVARAAGATYLLDACQSAGQMALDVERIGCDFLSATGRKYLRGPRGTGFLYASRRAMERYAPPVIDLRAAAWTAPDSFRWRDDAGRFENWENYQAGRIGLGVAVDLMLETGIERIEARVTELARILRERLAGIAGVTVRDLGRRRCGIVTFTHGSMPAGEVRSTLGGQGINLSVSDAGSTLIDMTKRNLPDLVRASVHYYNTLEEVDRFVEAVARLGR
ncbi:aminotransferase class V-fold PLP-dependent enzyme [Minwuia thermotolerans]|uniref:Aminotransferase n=1 Tax=Minwuia thermotolerans TaxID=2056226 RepID=A0A2M9G2C3_9PROT|nr:aminotransferase class V-fold PLP-dependent enzyme [Minwuia thermotolerans]PJK29871.1 aminotransferase [Minwuia thermotolerans]